MTDKQDATYKVFESKDSDDESWMNEPIYVIFEVRASVKNAGILKSQLRNVKGVDLCFVRTSPNYLYVTSKKPDDVRGEA